MMAAENGHLEVVKLLLDSGANIDATNHHGWTALMIASYQGHEEIIKILLDHRADFNKVPINGKYKGKKALEISICSEGHRKYQVIKHFIMADAFTSDDIELIKKHVNKILDASSPGEKIIILTNLIAASDDQKDKNSIKENIELLDTEFKKIHSIIDTKNFRIREKIDLYEKLLKVKTKIIDFTKGLTA